jgi:hypothetical protein
MSSLARFAAALILAASAVGCGSAGGARQTSAPRSSANVLVATDLEKDASTNLYDAIQRLRPEWFRRALVRTSTGAPGISVYLDNQRAGTLDVLRQFQPNSVASVRYYSASEAQSRFGIDNLNGAIQIVTRDNTKP